MPLIRAELQRRKLPRPGPLLHDLSQVLYLPFDHDDGSKARDRSGYNNHGTLYGPTREPGKVADALNFDGVDDYVRVPDDPSLRFPNGISIGMWCRADREDVPMSPFGQNKEAEGFINLWFDPVSGMRAEISYDPVPSQVSVFDGITTIANVWKYYVLTYDNKVLKIYTDGDLKAQTTQTGQIPTITADATIGGYSPTEYFWDGIIDEVRIYNRALSQVEIVRVMNMRGLR